MTKSAAFIATAAAALAFAAPVSAEPLVAVSTSGTGPKLLKFDSATPGTVKALPISGLVAGDRVRGIDYRPANGLVYLSAVNGTTLATYVVDTNTGQAGLVGITTAVLGAADAATGFDFNPTVDRIRYFNEGDENARLHPDDGSLAADDTNLTAGMTTPSQDLIAGAYDRNRPPAMGVGTTLYAINRSTSSLSTIGGLNSTPSPNGGVVNDIGPLGVTPVGDAGFDISGATDAAYAAINTNPMVPATTLYTINLTTGAATPVGLIGGPQGVAAGSLLVDSLTAIPAPAPGPQGPAGADGADGADGAAGTTGTTGPQGPAGSNGTNGTNGTDGKTGATGSAGPIGPQGPAGADGRFGAVLGSSALSGRVRRSLAVRFAVTRSATVRIEIRKGSRLISRVTRSVSGGRRTIAVKLPGTRGTYRLLLRATTTGGGTSNDAAKLTVRR